MKTCDCNRQLIEALRQIKAEKHHNLDVRTLEKIDELISLLSKDIKSQTHWKSVIILFGVVLAKLPKLIELLNEMLGE